MPRWQGWNAPDSNSSQHITDPPIRRSASARVKNPFPVYTNRVPEAIPNKSDSIGAAERLPAPGPLLQPPTSNLNAWLAWLAVSFFWGTTYLAIRVGVQSVPTAILAGSRFLLAGAILWSVRRAMGDRNPTWREWRVLGIVGFLLLVIGNGLVVAAERWVESGMASLAVSLMPIWMAVLGALLPPRERLTARSAGGLAMGMGGLLLLLSPAPVGPERAPHPHRLLGILFLEIACLSWAGGSIFVKRQRLEVSPLMGAAAQMLAGGVLLLLLSALSGEWHNFHPTWEGAASIGYLVVFGSLVGYGAYMFALAHLPATTVSLYAYINPVVALAAGALFLHEPLSRTNLAAAGIILSGVALARKAP